MIGERYGMLEVIAQAGTRDSSGQKKRYALVKCDCGTTKEVRYTHLIQGRTKACGCVKPGKLVHGQCGTRLYDIWQGMKQRCYYEKGKAYPYYGARGVTICEEWLEFKEFHTWSMANGYTDELTIDRVNNSKIYSPTTCEWVTLQENIRRRDVCKAGGRI